MKRHLTKEDGLQVPRLPQSVSASTALARSPPGDAPPSGLHHPQSLSQPQPTEPPQPPSASRTSQRWARLRLPTDRALPESSESLPTVEAPPVSRSTGIRGPPMRTFVWACCSTRPSDSTGSGSAPWGTEKREELRGCWCKTGPLPPHRPRLGGRGPSQDERGQSQDSMEASRSWRRTRTGPLGSACTGFCPQTPLSVTSGRTAS